MSSDDVFLAAAETIGRQIVNDAVWHDGICSWVGAVAEPTPRWRAQYRALDPVLYDGTAGVGLFLAQLADLTGEASVRRTAIGALRHAVSRARTLPPARRDGLHAGALGVAWATARGAALLHEDELRSRALTLPATAGPASGAERRHDVVMGSAGTILALLALADAFQQPYLIDEAVRTGHELVGAATLTRHGWSWAAPGRRGRAHLCGLAHGAAGIAWALVELHAATGDEEFRTASIGAFSYERSWQRAGAWPDLRLPGQRRGAARPTPSPAIGTWCHGEGGIALTRLRAMDVLDAEVFRDDAELALETTRAEVAAALAGEIEDLTLCHGAAGSADVLMVGAAALGDRWQDEAGLAARLGHTAIERYGDDWPCGPAGGTTPTLFRGSSGIGWWFLRLHDPAIPSPLALPFLTAVHARA